MTGSGMGCPDWPQCFGSIIPPTDVTELPEDYKAHYIEVRKAKNLNLAKMLRPLGFEQLATQISEDPSIYEGTEFVWQRTWTEYVNRLAGATLGLVLLAGFFTSLMYWKKRKSIPLLMFGIIVITGFQGWLGSVVVSTNLLPGILTVHMMLAFVIIAGLVYLYVKTALGIRTLTSFSINNTMRYALGLLIALTLFQVLFGTQVRQQIDIIAKSLEMQQRELWIAQLDWIFKLHRSFALVILVGNGWICYQLLRYLKHYFAVYRAAIYLGAFVLVASVSGIVMAYLNVPIIAQPFHLLFSCLIFGAQVYLFYVLGRRTRIQTISMTFRRK